MKTAFTMVLELNTIGKWKYVYIHAKSIIMYDISQSLSHNASWLTVLTPQIRVSFLNPTCSLSYLAQYRKASCVYKCRFQQLGVQSGNSLCVVLTELRDVHKADKTLFLGVSVREFLEEINVRYSRLSKEIRLPKVDGHHSIPGVEENRKARSLSF